MTDLISRADAIEVVRKCVVESELLADWNKAMESAQELLSALPSADADVCEDYEHATLVDIKEPLVKHDRAWIIGCIKHDGFIKTDRFDKANQIILDALSADAVHIETYRELYEKYVELKHASADAVQGEWAEEDEYGDLWVCDQCGFASEYKDNYCPNCGARMKGGENE